MQDDGIKKTNRDRTATTKAALMEAARTLFAQNGYAQTSTPDLVKAAGITRGALYHHFSDKIGLMRAVIEAEALAVAEQIEKQTSKEGTALQALKDGANAYFQAIAEPERTRLLLIEGPSVLGVAVMREIDQQFGGNELKQGLEFAVEQGLLSPVSTDALSDILSAAFDKAALAVTEGGDIEEYKQAINTMLEGLIKQ